MNTTPKERVLRLHPKAFCAGGAGAWTVYQEPQPMGTPQKALGRGNSPSRAWASAARCTTPQPPGFKPKAQSFRGF
jgi:hypothetical protein